MSKVTIQLSESITKLLLKSHHKDWEIRLAIGLKINKII